MARALRVEEIIEAIDEFDVKEEIKLLDLLAHDVYKKINSIESDNKYWLSLGEKPLRKIWDNEEDEVYNELL